MMKRIMNNLIKKKYDEQSSRILLLTKKYSNSYNNSNNNNEKKNKRYFTNTSSTTTNNNKKNNNTSPKVDSNNVMPSFFDKTTNQPLLFDVDCNLTHKDLIADASEHVSAAVKIGVAGMVVPSMTISEAQQCLNIYEKFNSSSFEVRTTVGIHPYTAKEFIHQTSRDNVRIATMEEMKNMILKNKNIIAAIGECGLDYSDGFPDKSIQLPCFEQHLKLALELKMPLYIHHRNAFDDFVSLMDKYQEQLKNINILIHCFTGDAKELEWILQHPNYFISVSGYICKPKHGAALRNILIEKCKEDHGNYNVLNRIMIETDAPYLGFPNCRIYTNGNAKSKRKQYPNVPTSLPFIVNTLSTCLKIDEETIAIETKINAKTFFKI
jgi:TatD DNase family protein